MLTFSATASPIDAVLHMFDVSHPSIGGMHENAPAVPTIRHPYRPRYSSAGSTAEIRNPRAPTAAAPEHAYARALKWSPVQETRI